jgi:hypothetical protein
MRRSGFLLTAALLWCHGACACGGIAPSNGASKDSGSDADAPLVADAADAADVVCLKPGDSFQGPAGTGVVADGESCPVGYCYLCGILDLPSDYPAQCPSKYCAPGRGQLGECTKLCLDAGPDGG